MKALVTGGLGYIGGHLVKELLKKGYEVVVADTLFNSRQWRFEGEVAMVKASVADIDSMRRAMHKANAVFHLASRDDWEDDPRHVLKVAKTNTFGTASLLAAAQGAGMDNVIFTSSYEVYGNNIDCKETDLLSPVSLHGISKHSAENFCSYFTDGGMPVKVLRLFEVWGGEFSRSFVDIASAGTKVKLPGDGSVTRDFVHVKDVVAALMMSMYWDEGVYNVGTGVEANIAGVAKNILGRDPELYIPDIGDKLIVRSCANIEKIQKTGWSPRRQIQDIFKEE